MRELYIEEQGNAVGVFSVPSRASAHMWAICIFVTWNELFNSVVLVLMDRWLAPINRAQLDMSVAPEETSGFGNLFCDILPLFVNSSQGFLSV